MGRRVLLLRLGIQRQHPELVRLIADEIDDAQPATLASAFTPPAEFPYTARAANHRPRFRALHHELLQLTVLIVIEVVGSQTFEGSRLDKHEHYCILRLWRTLLQWHLDIRNERHHDDYMRTTLTLEDDLADRLAQIARETQQPFKAVVNETLRRGLAERAPSVPAFDYQPHPGNLLPGIDERRLNELAWQLDEERFRQ
jgi:hypothetical protein